MISIKWSETAQKNALASADVIVTQLLRDHMSLLYFVCNHLIYIEIICKSGNKVQPGLLAVREQFFGHIKSGLLNFAEK